MEKNYWSSRLRKWRKEKGLTQIQVGNLVEVSQSQMSQMENGGRNFTQKSLDKLLKFYNKNYNDLFGYISKEDLIEIFDHQKRKNDKPDFDPSEYRKPHPKLIKLLNLFR